MLLTCGALILIAFPYNILVYTVPHIFFLVLLQRYSATSSLFVANAINSSIFYFSVLIFTRMLYKNQVNQIGKNILLEDINKKPKDEEDKYNFHYKYVSANIIKKSETSKKVLFP